MELKNPFYIALDTSSWSEFTDWVKALKGTGCGFKVGMEAFYCFGDKAVDYIKENDSHLFLDLKLHDIPETTSSGIKNLIHRFEPHFINVHASGGRQMLEKTVSIERGHSKLLGVTVLTSLEKNDIREVFCSDSSVESLVSHMASLCHETGIDGVVCSAQEIKILKAEFPKLITMSPGIRLPSDNKHDQKRIMTPKEARALGADYLVIGRGITQAKDIEKSYQKYWDNYHES